MYFEEYQSSISIERDESQDSSNSKKISRFIDKTFNILKEELYEEFVSWNKNGSEFVIRQTQKFAEEVLWKFFGHRNLSSFTRQVYLYGFVRCASEVNQCAFMHPLFTKSSSRQQLSLIKRKKRASKNKKNLADKTRNSQNGSLKSRTTAETTRKSSRDQDQADHQRVSDRGSIPSEEEYGNSNAYCNFNRTLHENEVRNVQNPFILKNPQLLNSHNDSTLATTHINQSEPLLGYQSYVERFVQSQFESPLKFLDDLRLLRQQIQKENEEEDDEEAPESLLQKILARNGISW